MIDRLVGLLKEHGNELFRRNVDTGNVYTGYESYDLCTGCGELCGGQNSQHKRGCVVAEIERLTTALHVDPER